MIESASTIAALRVAIKGASPYAGGTDSAEIADARTLLAAAEAAATAYGVAAAATRVAYADWKKDYSPKFALLDRHSRYVLSFVGTSTTEIAFADDTTAHDTLITRAAAAAAAGAPSDAKTDLALYRAAFDTSWSAKPASEISDGSTEGVALTAALAKASAGTEFSMWAKANPT